MQPASGTTVKDVDGLVLSSQERDGSVIVSVAGDLDIVTCPALDECLKKTRAASSQVVLDLSAVGFIDTSGIAVIVRHWKQLAAAGGDLALAGARYEYTKTLWMTGLADRLGIYDSVEAALAGSVSERPGPVVQPGDDDKPAFDGPHGRHGGH
jgi:anti-sigma B factor antagonist